MTQDHKPTSRKALWIAVAVVLLPLGIWAYTVLADLRDVALSSEARNRIYSQTMFLTESDARTRVIGKVALPEIHPGLSWRVAILPMMDEQELYN